MIASKGLIHLTHPDLDNPKWWSELVEARREDLRPILDLMTLERLCDARLLRSNQQDDGRIPLRQYPHVYSGSTEARVVANSQGIYTLGYTRDKPSTSGRYLGTHLVWGILRKGCVWTVVEIDFEGVWHFPARTWDEAYDLRRQIVTLEKMLEMIPNLTAATVFSTLGQAVHRWMQKRKEAYETALRFSVAVSTEQAVLATLKSEKKG